MTLGLAASLAASLLIGVLSIEYVWWRPTGLARNRVLLGFLATGIGLGLSSAAYFAWLLLAGAPSRTFTLAELAVVVLLASAALYASKARRPPAPLPTGDAPAAGLGKHPLLAIGLVVSVGCATVAFLVELATSPQGGWDAWMTWNMHARAIFRGGDHWRVVLTGLPGWSHPDYPLLIPATIARTWTYVGRETPLAPAAVAMLFTFATVGVLYGSISILRSHTQGALAALLLLGTKFFILHGASQFADIPLSFFFLATLALLALSDAWPDDRRRLVGLAGLTAGLAAWTKNEGLLFLLAVLLGYGLVIVRARGWRAGLRDARDFAIGLAPILVVVLCFKIWLAPPNDLLSDQGLAETMGRLLDSTRYRQVLAGFEQAFLEVGAKGVVALVLLAYALCAGLVPRGSARRAAKASAMVLLLLLLGYAAVLLTAPAPLLGTNIRSINRLLLQVWPSMILAYFLAVRSAEEVGVPGQRPTKSQMPVSLPSTPS